MNAIGMLFMPANAGMHIYIVGIGIPAHVADIGPEIMELSLCTSADSAPLRAITSAARANNYALRIGKKLPNFLPLCDTYQISRMARCM